MQLLRKRLAALGAFCLLVAGLPVPAAAQESGDGAEAGSDKESLRGRSREIEEIIVQGVRLEGLEDATVSVTAFGAEDIENLRIQNVADLSAYTPNLEINTAFAASNPTLFIRGVGLKDYNSNSAGAVGIWQDGIMMNSPSAQLFSLFDIESIEVLRGPVGGLGGRNASAGVIRMHSFKPNGEWTSDGSFTYGNLGELGFEGALGFPIFPETLGGTLSARVSFVTEFRDGYTENRCANWDPEAFGLVGSTEENSREFYASLDPHDRGSDFPKRDPATNEELPRYVYRSFDAIERYNAIRSATRINFTPSQPEDGPNVGPDVGSQPPLGGVFLIPPDDVCGVDIAGSITTTAGANFGPPRRRKPEGTWTPVTDSKPLSDFQGLQDTYNNVEYYASRFQLRWEPTESWDILANFHWGENRGDSFHLQSVGVEAGIVDPDAGVITEPLGFFQDVNASGWSELSASEIVPFEGSETRDGLLAPKGQGGETGLPGFATDDPFSGYYSSDGLEKLDLRGTSVTVTYEPDWGRFIYVSGYEFNTRKIEDEGDDNPTTELEAVFDDEAWQITHDLRMEVEGDGYVLTLGGFLIHEEVESRNLFKSSIRFNTDQEFGQETDGWNLGAELHYDFLEEGDRPWLYQISFDGGVRYNWEQKDFSLESKTRSLLSADQVERDAIEKDTIRGIWRAWTGEATLSFKPLEHLRLYGKYTRGYKPGHFNAGLTIEPKPGGTAGQEVTKQSLDPVDDEFIDAIEVGLKSSWFDDRLELSGALFRYWYKDLQVFDIVNEAKALPTQQLLNADADVLGAELEMTLRPLDGLMFQGGLGWLDSSFRKFEITKQVVPPVGGGGGGQPGQVATFNYEDNPLIAAPEWSLSGYVEYELPLYRWGSLVPAFDFSYKSQVYLDPQQEELISQDPYWIFNARLSYRVPGGGIEVAGWVQNFMDEQYKIDAFDESRQFNHILEVWAEPRTYGVTISYSF
jgi:outer membrane receptor protein involved in Fe transport